MGVSSTELPPTHQATSFKVLKPKYAELPFTALSCSPSDLLANPVSSTLKISYPESSAFLPPWYHHSGPATVSCLPAIALGLPHSLLNTAPQPPCESTAIPYFKLSLGSCLTQNKSQWPLTSHRLAPNVPLTSSLSPLLLCTPFEPPCPAGGSFNMPCPPQCLLPAELGTRSPARLHPAHPALPFSLT